VCEDVDFNYLYILYKKEKGSVYLITITAKKKLTYTFVFRVSTRHHKHHSSLNSTPLKIKAVFSVEELGSHYPATEGHIK